MLDLAVYLRLDTIIETELHGHSVTRQSVSSSSIARLEMLPYPVKSAMLWQVSHATRAAHEIMRGRGSSQADETFGGSTCDVPADRSRERSEVKKLIDKLASLIRDDDEVQLEARVNKRRKCNNCLDTLDTLIQCQGFVPQAEDHTLLLRWAKLVNEKYRRTERTIWGHLFHFKSVSSLPRVSASKHRRPEYLRQLSHPMQSRACSRLNVRSLPCTPD